MQTNEVLAVRDEVSKFWHDQVNVWTKLTHFGFSTDDRYTAFCVAKDWLQDTGEALLCHRRKGFSPDPYQGYIEFWGVLQATFVQQDALAEMRYAASGKWQGAETMGGRGWKSLRDLRNRIGGHPTRKDRGTDKKMLRSVTSRQTMTYDAISVMFDTDGKRSHANINLGEMMDAYDREAVAELQRDFEQLQTLVSAGLPDAL